MKPHQTKLLVQLRLDVNCKINNPFKIIHLVLISVVRKRSSDFSLFMRGNLIEEVFATTLDLQGGLGKL